MNNMQELQNQIVQLEQLTKQHLSREALTRYSNIKAVDPEKAVHITSIISQLVQQGQINQTVTDEQFKQLLIQLQPKKKEFKFTRK